MAGSVEEIVLQPVKGAPAESVESVEVLAGQGPRGDHHFAPEPRERPGKDLTLIEAEALEGLREDTGIELGATDTRRNLLTRGVGLNALVGKRFRVGEVECEGVMLNEPCAVLEKLTQPGVLKGLVHRGGLRANVLSGGTIAVGDPVEPLAE